MELPIKITGDNVLIDELIIVDNKFCYLILEEKKIIRKTYCRVEYIFDSGIRYTDDMYHINEEVFLSSEMVGVEMCTYIRDSNKTNPSYLKILFRFKGGFEIFMCFEDPEECKASFKIAKQYFNYIHNI